MLGYLDGNVAEEPPTAQPAAKALLYQTRYCQVASEPEHPRKTNPSWLALQKDLVSLSTNSVQVIATRSGHPIHLEQPELVIAAIKQVLTGKVQVS